MNDTEKLNALLEFLEARLEILKSQYSSLVGVRTDDQYKQLDYASRGSEIINIQTYIKRF